MVSNFITDRIDNAHALIDQGSYVQAVELLKNIKHRIHKSDVLNEIDVFEKEHDKKLKEMVDSIYNSGDDSLRKQENEVKQYHKYSATYLSFYDRITKDHDI